MNISAPFIRRPIATSLLSIAVLLAGAVSFTHLSLSALPEVEYPTISVSSQLPGASPDTMASAVATPLERMFGRIAGVNEMTSVSRLGSTNIVMQFDLDRDINAAARDVQAAINAARGQLPPNLPTNPNWREVNPAEVAPLVLSISSDTATEPQLYDLADSILGQKISQVPGMGTINFGGSARPAVRAEINPFILSKVAGYDQVASALNAANALEPKGQLADGKRRYVLNDNDQLFTAKEYAPLIVAYSRGAPVRLSDVARVVDASEDSRNSGTVNGKPSVLIFAHRQPGVNLLEMADRIKALIPFLAASIPSSVHIDITQDRTTTIRASVRDIEISLLISVVLVVGVVFVFLRNVWATAIPGVAVPLSLVGTFGVMYLLGYTLDNLSLMALTISTGFVVDDAIVVVENITRYIEQGMTPVQASLRGSQEIGFTVLSMSTSLIAVFIPILLMGGVVGRIFREFAVTLSTAVAISLVVSLTTTPALSAKLLKPHSQQKRGWFHRASEAWFHWLYEGYSSSLQWVLRHQLFTLAATVGTISLAVYLYVIVPKGFFPQQDTGRIQANVLASEDISFQSMNDKMDEYVAIFKSDPAVDIVSGFVGGGGAMNTAGLTIGLKPLGVRKASVFEVINRLRPKLARVAGATCFMQAVQDLQIGGRQTNAQFQFTVQGTELPDLLKWAPTIGERLKALPQLRDVSSDLQNRGLEAGLVIDRDTASRLGISAKTIDNVLYDAFGQRQVSTMYERINQYHVVMEIDPKFQQDPDALNSVYVTSSTGQAVPLSSFTHYQPSTTYLAVSHTGQFPSVTFSFNLAPNVPLGDAVQSIESTMHEIVLPSTLRTGFGGTAQAFQDSLASERYLIIAALATVYIVLGMLYENFIHPITILSTLPSAGVGALLALMLFHTELTIIAFIGIILLVGIVMKNAILMIDFAIANERKSGNSPESSIYEACLLRFRPIMMTTMAAMFGGLPIALAAGNGAELRRPLGIAIVGGLLFSQLLTLYTTPVIYLYMDRFRAWLSGGKALRAIESPTAAD